jgi:hypothetical protein
MRMLRCFALLAVTACVHGASGPPSLAAVPFPVDSSRVERVADGVWHRYVYSSEGPWAVHALDVQLGGCNALVAVKGAGVPEGRIRTTAMLSRLDRDGGRGRVVGGVNADFFSLANGTPTGLLVVDGRRMTAPSAQPVFAIDSTGRVHLQTFTLKDGALAPFHPRDAVGGRPMLLRDGNILADVDSAGQASFNVGRNPRSAAGISEDGRRVILAVIDGRQAPYSDGASLRETAMLMLALGARDAINLDGGGSSALVVADTTLRGAMRVVNRPSDREGERAVGDALAVVDRCAR